MEKRPLRILIVVIGAMGLSTIGIFASDVLQGVNPGVGNIGSVSGVCREGTVQFKGPDGLICVDIYEASPSQDCPNHVLRNTLHSEQNLSTRNCFAVSTPESTPWNFISLSQAQRACALAGKRLPTNDEWYRIALSTNIDACVVDKRSVQQTGTKECRTTDGVYDLVGNVWEWVDESVEGNSYKGRSLPDTGYVSEVDGNGIAVSSGAEPEELYGSDYFWSKNDGVSGMIRGGFYDGGEDAGLYATNASVPTSLATAGVGFRCVEDVI